VALDLIPDAPHARRLPQRLGAAEAPALARVLREAGPEPVLLDASEVTLLGTHCLQLLLAARRDRRRATCFRIVNPSEAFLRDAALLGCGGETLLTGQGKA